MVEARMRGRTRINAMLSALLGAGAVLVVPVLSPRIPGMEQAGPLLGAWLCVSALIEWSMLRRTGRRPIPIAFQGTTGPFRLSVRRRGREVTVQRGMRVVAQASTTMHGDRLVVHPDRVQDDELEALGVAIGKAMQVIAGERGGGAGDGASRTWPRGTVATAGTGRVVSFRSPSAAMLSAPRGPDPRRGATRAAYRPLVALTRRELAKLQLQQP